MNIKNSEAHSLYSACLLSFHNIGEGWGAKPRIEKEAERLSGLFYHEARPRLVF
jgi:hypothetical protein